MGGFLFPEQWLFISGTGGFFAPVYANIPGKASTMLLLVP
jgi:hypothetical protein